jgi:hypothetical protein
MLAACGGSQTPIRVPGAMQRGHAVVRHPEKSVSGELLYASAIEGSKVLVFSYPQGSLVQTLTGFRDPPYYICSDGSGDVFVPTTNFKSPGYIYEFAHGGSQPTETLTDPGPGYAQSCSVDPTTGNLAVANGFNVAVYPGAQGTPTVYEASDVGTWDCAYDDSGDLFVDGRTYNDKIAELPVSGTRRGTGCRMRRAAADWRAGRGAASEFSKPRNTEASVGNADIQSVGSATLRG